MINGYTSEHKMIMCVMRCEVVHLWQVLPYKQNDGVAMGPHVASHISMKGPCLCKLRLRQRFVNDIMSIVCKGQKLNYKWKKSPQGQVYVPRLEPMAPIRLADRNHAHYPSCRCTILTYTCPCGDFFHLYSY